MTGTASVRTRWLGIVEGIAAVGIRDALTASAAQTAEPVRASRPKPPTGFEPGVFYTPAGAEVTTEQTPRDVQHDPTVWADMCAELGFHVPDGYEVHLVEARYDPLAWSRDQPFVDDDPEGARRKMPATTRPAWRYRFRVVPAAGLERTEVDVAALLATARANRRRIPAPTKTVKLPRIVAAGDAQIGKVGSRGGVEEFLARAESLIAQLDAVMVADRRDEALFIDPGDLLEGFENVAAQQFTNDLSHPKQFDLARHFVTELVTAIAARHRRTRVVTVPSNHGAWRRGKDRLGTAGDDYGLSVYRAVADALARDPMWKNRITFILPDDNEVSLALTVGDDVIGIAHGDSAGSRPEAVPTWWAKQTQGDQPLAAASILITGHWHHPRLQPVGALAGRARWWIQVPTLDNGSDWWRHAAGQDDAPGLLTFTLRPGGGWDNLHHITA